MKIQIKSITKLHAIIQDGKIKDYKQGLTIAVNEIYEGNKMNEHYSKLYGCDEVFIEGKIIEK